MFHKVEKVDSAIKMVSKLATTEYLNLNDSLKNLRLDGGTPDNCINSDSKFAFPAMRKFA